MQASSTEKELSMNDYASSPSYTSTPAAGGSLHYPTWLRSVLWVDAVTGLASAILMLVATETVAKLLGLPASVLVVGALISFPFVALIALLLAKPQPPLNGLRTVVGLNVVWVVASVELLLTMGASMTPVGLVVGAGQAAFVAVLTVLQAKAAWGARGW
jgi:hypothetical protein